MPETAAMVVGVITDAMSLINDTLVQFRVFTGIVANHKEGCFDSVVLKCIEDKRGGFRDGTVIEGQVDRLLMSVHSPCRPGVKPAQPHARLLDNHLLLSLTCLLLIYSQFSTTVLEGMHDVTQYGFMFLSPLLVDSFTQLQELAEDVDVHIATVFRQVELLIVEVQIP